MSNRRQSPDPVLELVGWIGLIGSNILFVAMLFGLHWLMPIVKPSVPPWIVIVAVCLWPVAILVSASWIGRGGFPTDPSASED